MEIKEYNSKITNVISQFLFEFDKYIDIDGTVFLKNNFNKSYFGFSWFISERYKNEIVIRNTIYWVNYPEMENIVRSILVNNSLLGSENIKGTNNSFFIYDDAINLFPYDINLARVLDTNNLESVINDLETLIKFKAMPFYQKWNSLNTLYEFIKYKDGREELSDILGQFWQFKKAAILRLCNDENYQEYMDSFVERRKIILEKRPDSIDVPRYYNAAKELKEVLDKTVPVYNV